MRNMKTVITGGAGFIGSNLADELAKENEVIIIDDLSTGKMNNIKSAIVENNVRFIQGSVTDLHLLETVFQEVDYVFHQAAITSVPRSLEDPEGTNNVNINGTLNVLLASARAKVKKVIYASSSAIYGNSPTMPKREKMTPNPSSPYAVTKLSGEYYCQVFEKIHQIHTVCLRYFNVYGPRQDPNSRYAAVIPKFIEQILQGNPPVIYGDGMQTRDFIFVRDVVDANILAAEAQATGIFNIGTAKTITISELVKLIIELTGAGVEAVYKSRRTGEVRHSMADITRARTFGFNPRYDLNCGLRETIDQFIKYSK